MGEQGSLLGKLVALSSLVDYQKDAIVSRTLLRNPSGHIVLFAFNAAQELSEHASPHEVMVLAIELDEGAQHAVDVAKRTLCPQTPKCVQNAVCHASLWRC